MVYCCYEATALGCKLTATASRAIAVLAVRCLQLACTREMGLYVFTATNSDQD
jgi:hypothetical protein